jgi:hypothetical protein
MQQHYLKLGASQCTAKRGIFAALKVGEFAFFQLAVDKIAAEI